MAEKGKNNKAGCLKALFRLYGALVVGAATLLLVMAVIGIPSSFDLWMTTRGEPLKEPPRYIVCLGGAGIPSESGLIRTYHAAECARENTNAVVIVSLPCDGDPATNSVGRMRDELVMRGVSADRIRMEYRAWNTHQQAVEIARMLGPLQLTAPVLVVTQPYHCRRSLLCFRRAGFNHAACWQAGPVMAEADPGKRTLMRYGFWSTLNAELMYIRELLGMAYYWVRNWV